MTENKKSHFTDLIVILSVTLIVTALFFVYFYNVSLKFHISYADMYNSDVITKETDFHNDIIRFSDTLIIEKAVNFYIKKNSNNDNAMNAYIINEIHNSDLSDYITDIAIISENKKAYFSPDGKIPLKNLLEKYPQFNNIIKYTNPGISLTQFNDSAVHYTYKDTKGNIFIYTLNKFAIQDYLLSNIYPIRYNSVITSIDGKIMFSQNDEIPRKVIDKITNAKENSIDYLGNYLIITTYTNRYLCSSIISISDVLERSFKTSSSIAIFMILLLMLIGIISYYFYFKQKKLICVNKNLSSLHADVSTDLIIQKIFNRDIFSKGDSLKLEKYLSSIHGNYCIPIVVGIKNYNSLTQNNNFDDVTLFKYGFTNIISEVLSNIGTVKTVTMEKELMGFLLINDVSMNDKTLFIKNCNYYSEVINKNFSSHLFTVVGVETDNPENLYEQLPGIVRSQNYKFISEDEILFFEENKDFKITSQYPTSLEKSILSAIAVNDIESFKTAIKDFRNDIIKNRCLTVKEMYLRLFLNISVSCEKSNTVILKGNVLDRITECENINELTDTIFESVIFENIKNDTDRENHDFKSIVQKLIESGFSDPSFCLNSISESYGLTADYFGKKFKNEFNLSFNQYLSEYRISYSMKLLEETNYTSEKIAGLCGFNSKTYFITTFKKHLGMPPMDYKAKFNL